MSPDKTTKQLLWMAVRLTGDSIPRNPVPPHAHCVAMATAANYRDAVARLKQRTTQADVLYSLDYSADGSKDGCWRVNGPIPVWEP